jgi:YfiH family protein
MHNWHWRTWEGLPYLTCSLLETWSHGFFTQQFWPRSPLELTKVLQPNVGIYRVKQVHGNLVLTPSEIKGESAGETGETPRHGGTQIQETSPRHRVSSSGRLSDSSPLAPDLLAEADGIITEQPEQAVWVASADCTPALIADSETGNVAAVHAGWRGTAAKIVPQAIGRLQTQGSKIKDLRIALGPAIAGSVYQVSVQVAAEVGASIIPAQAEQSILDSLHQLSDSPLLPDPHPGRVRLDVRRVIALQLEHLGVSPEQVAIAPHCTYQQPEHFFSYRRDKLKKVQWSGIVSNEP